MCIYDQTLNPECPIAPCKVCFGIGKVSAQNTGPLLTQQLTSPCPACSGLGYDLKSCKLLTTEQKVVTVALPPGSRSGYKVVLPGEGHEVIENMAKTVGDLEVTVSSVDSGNFKIFDDRMELHIVMSVEEALNGFVYEEPYFEDVTLRIDRSDKLTIPDSRITLSGLGLRKINNSEHSNSTGTVIGRDDLIVVFELEPEELEDDVAGKPIDIDLDAEEEAVILDGSPTVIKSQEDLNEYLEKQKAASDLKFGRRFLTLLSKFNDNKQNID